jgi:hypothetical protein
MKRGLPPRCTLQFGLASLPQGVVLLRQNHCKSSGFWVVFLNGHKQDACASLGERIKTLIKKIMDLK